MENQFPKIATICWMYCVLAMVSVASAGGDTVARVTDLQGSAMHLVNGEKRNLRILARVKDGTTIQLEKGAMITLHFSAKRRDMRFIGPGTVKVKGQSANASNGVASTKDHDDIGISLDLSGSGLGGIIARSLNVPKPKVNLQYPVKSKVIGDRPVQFSWSSGGATAVYTLTVKQRGAVVYSGRTTGTTITLPSNISLTPGARYQWNVSADLGNGDAIQTASSFIVATQSETASYYAMSAKPKNTVSDLVLYALHLDQMELKSESDIVWDRLESLRPGISASR
ncbi:MAG: hypothetical protein KTR35_08010 [Gammaproteobacteria bacterium]|nr:hypothetical protein [Gammaproteobacteria bacterium]